MDKILIAILGVTLSSIGLFMCGYSIGKTKKTKGKTLTDLSDEELHAVKEIIFMEWLRRDVKSRLSEPFQEFRRDDNG